MPIEGFTCVVGSHQWKEAPGIILFPMSVHPPNLHSALAPLSSSHSFHAVFTLVVENPIKQAQHLFSFSYFTELYN